MFSVTLSLMQEPLILKDLFLSGTNEWFKETCHVHQFLYSEFYLRYEQNSQVCLSSEWKKTSMNTMLYPLRRMIWRPGQGTTSLGGLIRKSSEHASSRSRSMDRRKWWSGPGIWEGHTERQKANFMALETYAAPGICKRPTLQQPVWSSNAVACCLIKLRWTDPSYQSFHRETVAGSTPTNSYKSISSNIHQLLKTTSPMHSPC